MALQDSSDDRRVYPGRRSPLSVEDVERLTVCDATTLAQALGDGEQGEWWLEALGPLQVQGQCHVGRLLLTHGAGAGQDSAFLVELRRALADAGVQTLALEFAYLRDMRRTGRRRPPPRVERLVDELATWRDTLTPHLECPPWLGGKSMGGRVASMLAARDGAVGLALCGYPFHPPRRPAKQRLDHWPDLTCPTLVVQGERDPFGTRDEVTGYGLSDVAEVHWLADGEHDWRPRRASGLTQVQLIHEGAYRIAAFMACRA